MKKNLRSIILCLLIVFIFIGLKSQAQQDSTSIDSAKFYQVQGWQLRNSFVKMMRGHQLTVELNACTSLTTSLLQRCKESDSLLYVRERSIVTLKQLNENYSEQINDCESRYIREQKENKKKRIRQGIFIGSVGIVAGLLISVII